MRRVIAASHLKMWNVRPLAAVQHAQDARNHFRFLDFSNVPCPPHRHFSDGERPQLASLPRPVSLFLD